MKGGSPASRPKPFLASNWLPASGTGLWLAVTSLHHPPASEFHKIQPGSEQPVRGQSLGDYWLWTTLITFCEQIPGGSSLTLCHRHHIIRKLSITCQVRGWIRGEIRKLIHLITKKKKLVWSICTMRNVPVKIHKHLLFILLIKYSAQRGMTWFSPKT